MKVVAFITFIIIISLIFGGGYYFYSTQIKKDKFKCDGYGNCVAASNSDPGAFNTLENCQSNCVKNYKCNRDTKQCEPVHESTPGTMTDKDICEKECCGKLEAYNPDQMKCMPFLNCNLQTAKSEFSDFMYTAMPIDDNRIMCRTELTSEEKIGQCDLNDKYIWLNGQCHKHSLEFDYDNSYYANLQFVSKSQKLIEFLQTLNGSLKDHFTYTVNNMTKKFNQVNIDNNTLTLTFHRKTTDLEFQNRQRYNITITLNTAPPQSFKTNIIIIRNITQYI